MTELERRLMLLLEAIFECEIRDPDEGPHDDGWWFHVPEHLHERMEKALKDAQDKEVTR